MVGERRKGVLLSYVYIAVNSLIILVYLPIVKRTLGSSEYGLYDLAASVINYLSIMDLGFGNGIVVYTAKYHAAGRYEDEKKLHGMFSLIFGAIGIIAAAICIILSFNISTLFPSLVGAEVTKARTIMLIMALNLGLTFPLSMYGNIIVAHEKFVFSKLIAILRAILNPLIMIPLLVMGSDSIAIVCVMTAVSLGCLLSSFIYCRKRLGVNVRFLGFDKNIFKEILSYSVFIFIAEIVDKVNWSVDHFILLSVRGTAEDTVYAMASNYNQMVLQLSAAISGVMLPKISKMVAKNEGDDALNREFIKTSRLQFFLVFLVTCGFVMFGHKFVIVHSGADCENSYFVAVILIIASMIPITQSVAISIIKAKNKFKFRAFTVLAMAIANVAISIPLAVKYGSIGSAAGTAAALIIANVIVLNIYYQIRCGIDIKRYWREVVCMAVRFVPAIAVCTTLKFLFPLRGLYELAVYGSLFVVLYSITAYLYVMNTYEKDIVKRYVGRLIPGRGCKK
ncbi:MAG: oligosaccharide flippase family protein [Clostridia bacterium]|nr:oligosaccharide flippase family protein [Clostridia bacterium]